MMLCANIFPRAAATTDFRGPIVRPFNRAIRVRAAADLIMDIPTPPPLGAYPRVREVVESARRRDPRSAVGQVDTDAIWTPISDEFVVALRAERTRTGAPPTRSEEHWRCPPRCRW